MNILIFNRVAKLYLLLILPFIIDKLFISFFNLKIIWFEMHLI